MPDYTFPLLEQLRDTALPLAKVVNSACIFAGISANTQHFGEDEALAYLAEVEDCIGLPAIDPFRQGQAVWWMHWTGFN